MTPQIPIPKKTETALQRLKDELPYVSMSHLEAAHLLDCGHAGELVRAKPFTMRFPAAARPDAHRRRAARELQEHRPR